MVWASWFLPVLLIGQAIVSGPPPARTDRALIVVGLPGDDEHEDRFRQTAQAWQAWLTHTQQIPTEGVRVVFGERQGVPPGASPATREAIADEVAAIRKSLNPAGRLWVFVLGHANYREGHAYLHLPGPDIRDDELAAMFRGVEARESVFWITTPASGWFLPTLSAKGRIVVTATAADQEFNETEFPEALAEVARRGVDQLDADHDGKVSIWELFVATSRAVEERFASDRRVPTEHAQLDDNGDGRGVERPEPGRPDSPKEKAVRDESKDGEFARKTFLKRRSPTSAAFFHVHRRRASTWPFPTSLNPPPSRPTTM